MEKKRVEYIKALFNKKEKKGFFEKNKDTLGGLVSMFTLLGFVYTISVVLFQYVYSIRAANFYQIESSLFNQEDLKLAIRLSSVLILHLCWFFLSFIPLMILRMYDNLSTNTKPTSNISRKIERGFITIVYIIIMGGVDFFLSRFFVWNISIETIQQWYNRMAFLPSLIITVILFVFIILSICKFKISNVKKAVEDNLDHRKWLIVIVIIGFFIVWIILACFIHWPLLLDITKEETKIKKGLISYKIFSCLVLQYVFFNGRENSKLSILQIIIIIAFAISGLIILVSGKDAFDKNLKLLEPSQKQNYEIVQNIKVPIGTKASASNLQVVILYRGSQVLLMNGKIDGNETINPQEDMSSSNLVIDINSYEIQEASQYRFYRKKFNDVKTNAPENNDKQGE
jgi:membrane protein